MKGGVKMTTIVETRKNQLEWAKQETSQLRSDVGAIYDARSKEFLSDGEAGRLIRELVGLFIFDHRGQLPDTIQVGPDSQLDTIVVQLLRNKHFKQGYEKWSFEGGLVVNALERKLDRNGCK